MLTNADIAELTALRRELHRFPDVSREEGPTAARIVAALAPLSPDQLRLMWRISDEPIIALDGDTAGTRAALRVIDLALPLLEAGKGLRFALLPGGMDPDDLIKARGAGAMQALSLIHT